ncbi:Ferrichrome transport ATP-binding protein FhuC (TC 3.A.1.14.3) [plant metagenome]|uniref:Ferrichrome transport ATP-binding protein FhuC (TC 3.A.1.14.3) n=1 Tax=plant metagenome TaxID=1297885 RepID=A0A484Q1D0_9ZZZZ
MSAMPSHALQEVAAPGGLRVRGLRAGYRRKPVIDGLDLPDLRPGSVVALLGPNGAGKSTLLKTLAGIVPCTGEISLDGLPLAAMPPAERAARVGYMPQRLPDDLDMTVLDSLLSILRLRTGRAPITSDAAMARAMDTLDHLGIAALAMSPLHGLSGGQRQMASLAQALAPDPGVLLLDEPTSALDLRHQVTVMRTLRALAGEGRLVIVVLHDLSLAARWADEVVVLKAGVLCAAGTPLSALTPETLARAYGVRARVETCARGYLSVHADEAIDADPSH